MTGRKQKNIFLIVNPLAGRKNRSKSLGRLITCLEEKGCSVEVSLTRYSGHAFELASEAISAGNDLIVAVGGDGTVSEVARALAGTNLPMGIVPWGSGNGLALDLGIHPGIRKCSDILVDGSDTRLDVCRFNEHLFFCTAGVGFNAVVAEKMGREGSRGFIKYIYLVVQQSFVYKPVNVRIKQGNRVIDRKVFMLTFANASQFGNNAFIAPKASMNDDLIDVVIVNAFSKLWIPLVVVALFFRKISLLPFVECFRANEVYFETERPLECYYDGEPDFLGGPALVKIDKKKITVRAR